MNSKPITLDEAIEIAKASVSRHVGVAYRQMQMDLAAIENILDRAKCLTVEDMVRRATIRHEMVETYWRDARFTPGRAWDALSRPLYEV